MTRNTTLVVVFFALVLLAAVTPNPAAAQTADGQTPAVEEVCNAESGAAFGLCNAYCEAMDCHLAYDGNDNTSPNASATACLKVENRFMQLTARDLRNVPCEADTCPAGSEGCPCGDNYVCSGEMYCDEDSLTCEVGGDVF